MSPNFLCISLHRTTSEEMTSFYEYRWELQILLSFSERARTIKLTGISSDTTPSIGNQILLRYLLTKAAWDWWGTWTTMESNQNKFIFTAYLAQTSQENNKRQMKNGLKHSTRQHSISNGSSDEECQLIKNFIPY